MTDTTWLQASDLLLEAWRHGTTLGDLPAPVRPHTREEGYAVQALAMRASGKPLVGWKIAATSAAGQRHIAVDGPLAGRLLAERVLPMGSEVPLSGNHMRVAELEFAFTMGRTLEPRGPADQPYAVDEVMDAVALLHPAIEIPDSRFTHFTRAGLGQLIADNACAHQFMLGEGAAEGWRGLDLAAYPVTGWHCQDRGARVPVQGSGANVLGDPRLAMAWIANELSRLGIPLQAGQVVTTGTCVVPIPIAPETEVFGDFGRFGTVFARFV